jgi:DNA repair exonuclease SbcCD ATPase subunit
VVQEGGAEVMTDEELIARLRDWQEHDEGKINDAREAAADRIEAKAAEIERLEKACAEWAEVSQSNYQRAKTAEAKLAKAVEDLGEIAQQKKTDELETEYDVEFADFEGGYDWCIDLARTTLAELTGAKKDGN